MKGTGILKGLGVTFNMFFRKKVTQDYPDVMPDIAARSHGSFEFDAAKCISCGICVNECPNSCIKLDTVLNDQGKKTLDQYSINLGYCLFCGFCVDVCPKSAITFSTNFELGSYTREGTIYTWRVEEPEPEEGNEPEMEENPAEQPVAAAAAVE